MLSLPPAVRVFVCLQPTDMRRSFDGLAMLTEQVIRQNPFSGHLFVFCNRRRDRVKLLYWDRDGYAIWYKRLEKGVFRFPDDDTASVEIESGDLWLLLEGIELATVRRRERWMPPGAHPVERTSLAVGHS